TSAPLVAVGRKTRRAQEAVYPFRFLRAGFEPFRACANPARLPRCAKSLAALGVTQPHRGGTRTARLKTGARRFRRLGRTMGAPSFSPYRSGVVHGRPPMLARRGSRRTATGEAYPAAPRLRSIQKGDPNKRHRNTKSCQNRSSKSSR